MRSVVASHGPGSNPKCQKLKIFKIDQNRARYRILARKIHGLPGTGPNQTLEEIRTAVTTSPETRRSGGRPPAPPPRRSRRQRTTPRATSRGQRASCATSAPHELSSSVASSSHRRATSPASIYQQRNGLRSGDRSDGPLCAQRRTIIRLQLRGQREAMEAPLARRERSPCVTRRSSLDRSTAQRMHWTRPALRCQCASRARSPEQFPAKLVGGGGGAWAAAAAAAAA
ncbi:hypothetical protein F511_21119 [Dorcoceras hygrometricum]|uniref:Uncharacterized protein n=1 Tax=Dorcoceras hygrometricum TaxID=472368 RepID=A0A2Z7B4X1_9LAMI|nr:hypothetical protein F511_21119 [Dorcoceras hygrometricum]